MSGADLSDALSDMWRSVLLFVPTALAFLAILLIGYVLARLVRTVVVKTLRRIGFDRAVERGAVGKALGGRVEPSDLCAKIAFYAVLLFALQLAFGIWGPNAVSDLLTALIGWLPRAFVAIVIIVVAAAIGGAVRDLIGSALGGLGYGRVLAQAAYWLIVALGVIAALDQVQIATAVTQPVLIAVLATVAGVLIVGVGGGLIRPMQRRWEIWLERAGTESVAIREHARSYADERARLAAEKQAAEQEAAREAEEAARVAEELAAEQARKAEEARAAEAEERARAAAAAEADRIEAAEEAARRRALEAAAVEKTQVIPTQRPWPGSDDSPHPVPGFDDSTDSEPTTRLFREPASPRQNDDGPPTAGPDDDTAPTPRLDDDTAPTPRLDDDTAPTAPSDDDTATIARSGGDGSDGDGVVAVRSGAEDDGGAEGDATVGGPAAGAVSARELAGHGDAGPRQGAGTDDQDPPSRDAPEGSPAGADDTAPIGGEPSADRDPDSTIVISPSERRQALPHQPGPADGEKTQVIRVRRDDGSKP